MEETIAKSFNNVTNGSSLLRLSIITSKSLSKNLSNENKHTIFQENWHLNSCFVLKTTKTAVYETAENMTNFLT